MAAKPSGNGDPISGMKLFAEELAAQRAKRKWTQVETADKLGYSNTYLSEVEREIKVPSPDFATQCDMVFGCPETFVRLLAVAKLTLFPDYFAQVVPYEEKAIRINGWELGSVPGLLQTEDYTRSLIRATLHDATNDRVETIVAARMARQEIHTKENPPKLWYVIDESALQRMVGGAPAMARQMGRLIEATSVPGNVIQVLPFANATGIGTPGPIAVYEFEAGQPVVAYAECYHGGRLIDAPEEVAAALTDLSLIRMHALSPAASTEFLERHRREYEQRVA